MCVLNSNFISSPIQFFSQGLNTYCYSYHLISSSSSSSSFYFMCLIKNNIYCVSCIVNVYKNVHYEDVENLASDLSFIVNINRKMNARLEAMELIIIVIVRQLSARRYHKNKHFCIISREQKKNIYIIYICEILNRPS